MPTLRSRALPTFVAATLLVVANPAQVPTTPPTLEDEIRRHLAVVKRPDAPFRDRASAAEALLDIGWLGPHRLATELSRQLAVTRKAFAKEHRALVKDFARKAHKVVSRRLDGRARKEIEAARKVVMSNARQRNLTKDRIVKESDAAVETLRGYLTVTVDQVFDADPKLSAVRDRLEKRFDDELWLYETWARAHDLRRKHRDASRAAREAPWEHEPEHALKALDDELAAIATDAMPMSGSDRKVLAKNEEIRDQIEAEEFAGVLFLNRLRILLGVRPYVIDVKLCKACRGHSKDMRERGFFSHTSPVPGKRTFGQRAAAAGTSAMSENIARGASRGSGAIMQWWYSPGHHRNMMGSGTRVGLGTFETFWTQCFG